MTKKYLLLLCSFFLALTSLFLSPCNATEAEPYTVIEDEAKVPLLTPTFSERKVLKIRLSNGLEAYLVSDPKTDKSGAVLSVNVGSWEEPREHPGLAHFLEHMLFMGTKKYPNESEYAHFITENGGSYNAFTSNIQTSYMFTVNNNAFPAALDRFSDFFVEPLFNPSGVARELQAIDQEYAKNLENDDVRLYYVDKGLSNPEHPYHGFQMGNSSTLSKVSQETLKEWYRTHYSANLMHLIVYSAMPIDQLKDLVVNEFKNIPNTNRKPFRSDMPVFKESENHDLTYVEPVKNKRTLALIWELPSSIVDMRDSSPEKVICHILGHEGQESLLAQLKREGLAESISCGSIDLSTHNAELVLEIGLTEVGLKNVNIVIERCFQELALLRETEMSRILFEEIHRMGLINYQYQSREDLFQALMKQSHEIVQEDLKTYPEQSQIVQKYDPNAIRTLANLLTPQRAHYYLMAPAALTGITYDHHEKWLGANYAVKPIDNALLEKWSQAKPHPDITLPTPNRLIPQQLSLVTKAGATAQKEELLIPRPEILQNNEAGIVYFAQDTRYRVPQIRWFFEIKTPQVEMGNIPKTVLADLYVKSVSEAMNGFTYLASLAGLNFKIQRNDYGISITVDGYSENADLLLDEIIKNLKNVKPTEEQFNVYRESLERKYQNFAKKLPLEQAAESLRSVIYKKYVTEKQKAAAVGRTTYEKFKEYIARLYDQTYIEAMLYGNMTQKQAIAVAAKIAQGLQGTPYAKGKQRLPEVIMLPEQYGPFYWELNTKAQGNAIVLAIEYPTFDFKLRAAQQVLMQAMNPTFFATLRTKQQTGYIVYSEGREIEKHLFNMFAVQSNTHNVHDLLARFELFLEGYLQELNEEVPVDKFELNKQTLLIALEQPPKSVEEMGELLQKMAFEYKGDFDWIEKRIKGLKELTYPEFVNLANTNVGRNNKRRVAILLKGVIPEEDQFNYDPISNLNVLRRISTYGGFKTE